MVNGKFKKGSFGRVEKHMERINMLMFNKIDRSVDK